MDVKVLNQIIIGRHTGFHESEQFLRQVDLLIVSHLEIESGEPPLAAYAQCQDVHIEADIDLSDIRHVIQESLGINIRAHECGQHARI